MAIYVGLVGLLSHLIWVAAETMWAQRGCVRKPFIAPFARQRFVASVNVHMHLNRRNLLVSEKGRFVSLRGVLFYVIFKRWGIRAVRILKCIYISPYLLFSMYYLTGKTLKVWLDFLDQFIQVKTLKYNVKSPSMFVFSWKPCYSMNKHVDTCLRGRGDVCVKSVGCSALGYTHSKDTTSLRECPYVFWDSNKS